VDIANIMARITVDGIIEEGIAEIVNVVKIINHSSTKE